MAIPQGTKFHGVATSVDTVNKGSAQVNALRDAYTLEQIQESTSPGWARYVDTQYTQASPFSLTDGVQVILPNNGGSTTKSRISSDFYDSSTKKIVGLKLNEVQIISIEFKAEAPNANQTYLDLAITNGGGNIQNLEKAIGFVRGNATTEIFHNMFQYYIDQEFIDNGATIKIKTVGGSGTIWDIEYFIQRSQYGE
jgi:hypothetical protein